jgi:serine/threonine protein kinase
MKINFEGERYTNINPDALNLLKQMLSANPKDRISACHALNHNFFRGYETELELNEKVSSPCHTEASVKRRNFYVSQK